MRIVRMFAANMSRKRGLKNIQNEKRFDVITGNYKHTSMHKVLQFRKYRTIVSGVEVPGQKPPFWTSNIQEALSSPSRAAWWLAIKIFFGVRHISKPTPNEMHLASQQQQSSGNLSGGSNRDCGGRRPMVGQMEAKVKDLYGIKMFTRFNRRVYCQYYISVDQGHTSPSLLP